MRTNTLGGTLLRVSEIGIGTSPLGGNPAAYGFDTSRAAAAAVVGEVLQSPIKFLDTSNEYSGGESERRIGEGLRKHGGKPADFLVATKVDPRPGEDHFSGDRVRASLYESSQRLGIDHFPLVYLHDPERFPFAHITAPGGALDTLIALKAEGRIGHIGIAAGRPDEIMRYLDTGVFEVLLHHNMYNLLLQSSDRLIERAQCDGIAFVNAAPFASGILAKAASEGARFFYGIPTDQIRAKVARLRSVCDRHEVELAAVALQFSTRDRRIASTVVGVSKPGRVGELLRLSGVRVPPALWTDLADAMERPQVADLGRIARR
ncbi:aldo/keto reductase [Streptodolium elevatio]